MKTRCAGFAIRGALAAAGLMLSHSDAAWATSLVIETAQFSGPALALISLDPFEDDLGTLESIDITITGAITGSVLSAANLDPSGAPIPYTGFLSIEHDFNRLFPGRGFETTTLPASFIVPTLSTGVEGVINYGFGFTYSFTVDSGTDLTGLEQGTPTTSGVSATPTLFSVTRDSFLASTGPGPLSMLTTVAVSGLRDPRLTPTSPPSISGIVVATYEYAPAPPVSAAVPIPAGLPLLVSALGLISLFGFRRPAA